MAAAAQDLSPSPTPSPQPSVTTVRPSTGARLRRKSAPRRPSRGHDDFLEPLRFDPEDNGLSIDNPQLKWRINKAHDQVDLGGLIVDQSMIGFALEQISRDKATARYDALSDAKKGRFIISMSFRWPESFAATGDVSLETADEQILWSKPITAELRKSWRDDLSFATEAMRTQHAGSQWGMFDIDRSKFKFLLKGRPFRACFTNEVTEVERVKSCSPLYVVRSKGELIRLFPVKTSGDTLTSPPPSASPLPSSSPSAVGAAQSGAESSPENSAASSPERAVPSPTPAAVSRTISGFYVGESKLNDTGLLNFTLGKPVLLKMKFADSSFFEIASEPADPKLLDVVQSPDGKEIILTGTGTKPLGTGIRVIQRPVTHFWAPTGIPQERIWQVAVRREIPTVRVLGAFHVPFTMFFAYDRLPKEADRVYVQETRSSGTYSAHPVVSGYVPSATELSTDETSVQKTDAYHFDWKFSAPVAGAENRSRLTISPKAKGPENGTENARPWVAHYRMYRTYPYEISARMMGIMEPGFTFLLMGELSAAGWFETLAGWQNKTLSKQRWGLASRYFQLLNSVHSTTGTAVTNFNVLNVDLKYNLLPGIWHRDELVGLNFSGQEVQIAGITVNLVGGGIYWARTMPKIFDQIFSIVPIFDFPKYVDLEFIAYPFALTSGATGGSTYALNFHGRVFWTHRIYGEAGFGLRRYQFTVPRVSDPTQTSTLDLTTSYGSFGIGAVF